MDNVSSTELQRELGKVISKAKRSPITVTSHGREEVVICDAEYFKRLQALDTRQALYTEELDQEWIDHLEKGEQWPETPELDHLLD